MILRMREDKQSTLNSPAKPSGYANVAVLRDIATQSSTLRNTVQALKDEARSKQVQTQGVQDYILVKELQHVCTLAAKLCGTVGTALAEISSELDSDRVPGQPHPTMARDPPRGLSPRKVTRSATPPQVHHTLTSTARLQRVSAANAPHSLWGQHGILPVKVSRVSPHRSASPVLGSKRAVPVVHAVNAVNR